MVQRRDYYTYREGVNPDLTHLRLGNLVLDFENPNDWRPFRHPEWSDASKASWQSSDIRSDVQIVVEGNEGWDVGGGIGPLGDLSFAKGSTDCTIIVGGKGSKEIINEPEKYLEDVMLKNSDAIIWLATRLSVTRSEYLRKKLSFQKINIWMLTGRYVIENAAVWSLTEAGHHTSVVGMLPLPDPTAITQLLQLNPTLHYKVGSNMVLGGRARFSGRHVWAARYQKVGATFSIVKHSDAFPTTGIRLLNVYSRQRSGDVDVATLELQAPASVPEELADESSVSFEDMVEFEKEVEQMEAMLD